jgi:hypothetical protein
MEPIMKRLLAVLAAFSISAHAQLTDNDCTRIEDRARQIMQIRQLNVPMSQLMELYDRTPSPRNDFYKEMVMEAYKYPIVQYEENRKYAQDRFALEYAHACFRAVRSGK